MGPLRWLRREVYRGGRCCSLKARNTLRSLGKPRLSLVHLLLALPVGTLGVAALWRRWANNIRRRLALQVTRRRPVPLAAGGASEAAATADGGSLADEEAVTVAGFADNKFLKALTLIPARCAEEPFLSAKLCSLLDYFLTLDAGPHGVSAERIFVSLLSNAGMGALLPLAHLMTPTSAQQQLAAGDTGHGFTSALFRKLLSPLKIFAISTALSDATADMQTLETVTPAIEFFVRGEEPGMRPPHPHPDLSAVLVLETDVPAILAAWGLSPADTHPRAAPLPTSPDMLPDLCFSYANLEMSQTPYKAGMSRIMSQVFNRLSANAIPEAHLHGARRVPLTVYLTQSDRESGKPGYTSPEELLLALRHGAGKGGAVGGQHGVRMGMVTRVTSFGYGLSVLEGEEGGYTNVPVLLPLETGLELLESSDPSGAKERIIMPACHAGIFLEVEGPLVSFGIEWYQGIEGFTGWHNANDYEIPWANHAAVCVRHDDPAWTTAQQWRAAMETTTVAATALNVTASLCKLPNGGYGYLGICMDSVAAVQAALTGATTLFPLILCGHVKGRVMLLYKELEREFGAAGKANLASAAAALRLGMSSLPTDVVHQPRDTDAICNRLLAMLPTRSPFALVADCERKVALLKAQVSVISNDDNKLGRTFSQTRAKGFQRGVMHNLLHPTKSNGHAT